MATHCANCAQPILIDRWYRWYHHPTADCFTEDGDRFLVRPCDVCERTEPVSDLSDYEADRRYHLALEVAPQDKAASRARWFGYDESVDPLIPLTPSEQDYLADVAAAQAVKRAKNAEPRWNVSWTVNGGYQQHLSNVSSTSAVKLFRLLNKRQPGIVILSEEA